MLENVRKYSKSITEEFEQPNLASSASTTKRTIQRQPPKKLSYRKIFWAKMNEPMAKKPTNQPVVFILKTAQIRVC
jgi:hypothetical protein